MLTNSPSVCYNPTLRVRTAGQRSAITSPSLAEAVSRRATTVISGCELTPTSPLFFRVVSSAPISMTGVDVRPPKKTALPRHSPRVLKNHVCTSFSVPETRAYSLVSYVRLCRFHGSEVIARERISFSSESTHRRYLHCTGAHPPLFILFLNRTFRLFSMCTVDLQCVHCCI